MIVIKDICSVSALIVSQKDNDLFFRRSKPKRMVVSTKPCRKNKGQIILIVASGSCVVRGWVRFVTTFPIKKRELKKFQHIHCMPGDTAAICNQISGRDRSYYFAWIFGDAHEFSKPMISPSYSGGQWRRYYLSIKNKGFIPKKYKFSMNANNQRVKIADDTNVVSIVCGVGFNEDDIDSDYLTDRDESDDDPNIENDANSFAINTRMDCDDTHYHSKNDFCWKAFLKNEFSEYKDLIDFIFSQTSTQHQFLQCISYTICCLRRNKSVRVIWKQWKTSDTNRNLFWSKIKNFELHFGLSYVLFADDTCVNIPNWKSACIDCSVATLSTFDDIVLKEFGSKHKRGHASHGSASDPWCAICKRSGYKCTYKGNNPFLFCSCCNLSIHLEHIPKEELANAYYSPTLSLPNKRYERALLYQDTTTRGLRFLVPDQPLYKCVLCKSIDFQYLFSYKNKHYFLHHSKIVKYGLEQLNCYYLAQLDWWKTIDSRIVNYDRWKLSKQIKCSDANSIFTKLTDEFLSRSTSKNDQFIEYMKCRERKMSLLTIECRPRFWKSGGRIGTTIIRNLCLPRNHFILRHILMKSVCSSYEYYDENLSVSEPRIMHISTKKSDAVIEQYPEQYDVTKDGKRIKFYNGPGHYNDPVNGNSKINKIKVGAANQAVVSKLNESNSNFDCLHRLCMHYYGAKLSEYLQDYVEPNGIQINAYEGHKQGIIENHKDSQDHYVANSVYLTKTYKNSGVHFGYQSRRKRSINPYLFHPLYEGDFLIVDKYAFNWFDHCKMHWMNSDTNGSITTILRRFRPEAMWYPYPRTFVTNNVPLYTEELVRELKKYYQNRMNAHSYSHLTSALQSENMFHDFLSAICARKIVLS